MSREVKYRDKKSVLEELEEFLESDDSIPDLICPKQEPELDQK